MDYLVPVNSKEDIFPEYRNTPVGKLLEYHNLGASFDDYDHAELLIGMCMDYRKSLHIPENFAYVLRTGGGNLKPIEFKVSYAIAVGNVKALVLIGHNNCGMSNLSSKKEKFVNGLVDRAGWEREMAEQHFDNFAPFFEIGNEIDFVLSEAKRLRLRYPKIPVVPMFYVLEDNRLYLMKEK
ncbi:carbonic anhydrase [Desulfolucanica intricata]|uniref:carbonic anhydrase n=1 Tax=Desulfolucanica intricata TaxID=1285191 RepID=UPI00082CD6B0|nr:carbonic anhydrase [Desulfolucanica intricata]